MAAKKKAKKKVAGKKPRPRDMVSIAGRCDPKTREVSKILKVLRIRHKLLEGNKIEILAKK